MKAIGVYKYLPIKEEQSLVDIQIDTPSPNGQDLLVAVKAISVNPVDTKIRAPKDQVEIDPRILGWDAVGEVVDVGSEVEYYAIGDQVYYAGDITRPGSNSEFQLVDERIVGKKPVSLSFAESAALPLTSITAWEALFDRLGVSQQGDDSGKSILIIGGAGGVGSVAIQLANKLTNLEVIATASREESRDWCLKLGANRVINHYSMLDELAAQGIKNVDYILCLNNTYQHWLSMVDLIAAQGRICSIVETTEAINVNVLKSKSATFVWEFMFTRSMYQTKDMIEQKRLLDSIANLIDRGELITTVNRIIRPINAKNLRQAHAMIEEGNTIGKIVLEEWS